MAQSSGNPSFSSQSYSPSPSKNYASVSPANNDPLNTKIIPQDQQAKTKEKDQMVGLNDKFVAIIDEVRRLEQEKNALETRRKLLLNQDGYKAKPDRIVKEIAADLKRKIDELTRDKKKLQAEVEKNQEDLDKTRARYEEELQKKNDLESDFIITKKDLDNSYLQRVNLELMLEELAGKIDFVRRGHEEEIKELKSLIHNETVTLKTDNTTNLDMDEILQAVKVQYEDMAARSRVEVEQWNQRKMDDMILKAGRQEDNVKDIRKEISEVERIIQKLQSEIEFLNRKKKSLEDDITKAEDDGQTTVSTIRDQISMLEDALRRDRMMLAELTREYHELLNLKMALDIEIATYKKILEGEEMRMADQHQIQQDF